MSNVFTYSLFKNSSKVMHVKLFVADSNLKAKYQEALTIHNNKILSTNFPDAGFDLFVPEATACLYENLVKINFGVKSSAMMVHDNGTKFPTGFYLYARSCLGSKTKLRLANSVGIIDSGYRGDLIGCFDCLHLFTFQTPIL
jgi:dUTPase